MLLLPGGRLIHVARAMPTVLAWLDGQVPRYKLPRRVVFWEELPKSAYGKITKKIIREELQARGYLDDTPAGPSD